MRFSGIELGMGDIGTSSSLGIRIIRNITCMAIMFKIMSPLTAHYMIPFIQACCTSGPNLPRCTS